MNGGALLSVKGVTAAPGGKTVFTDISFELRENSRLMVIGPNGAGKTTLIRTILGSIGYEGEILLMGRDIRSMSRRETARNIGVFSQNHNIGFPFTVREIVRLGRYSYSGGILSRTDNEADEAVRKALKLTGLDGFEERRVLTLSGGELQRVFLAQVFAQDPKIMILDEPANHLDLVYQKLIFDLIAEWSEKPGRAVIAVVHDLSLARAYGTEALLLGNGRIEAQGSTDEVFSPEKLRSVYSMDVCKWMRDMLGQWT